MKQYLIATHGEMASGLSSTIRLLVGAREDITYLDAYVKKDSITAEIEAYFKTNKESDILVFTDLLAGSVNREMIPYLNDRVQLIAGFNLPLLLECLFYEGPWTSTWIKETITQAQTQMVHVNEMMKGENQI